MTRDAPFDHAVVGGGAAGLAVLLQLLERAPSGTRVALFEKSAEAGPGLAYSEACAGTYINMHAGSMGIFPDDPGHFVRWLKQRPCVSGRTDFPTREHYGRYLSDVMLSTPEIAKSRGITLKLFNNEVIDLRSQSLGWAIHLANGSIVDSSAVALALGNFMPTIHKHLRGKPLYFDRPWPNHRLLSIPKTASVCIIGSRLTAIDEAMFLVRNGHTGPIALASRTGRLPKVQAGAKKYSRSYALHNLARELETSGSGGFITIAKRIYDEIRNSGKGKSFLSGGSDDIVSQFRLDLEQAKEGSVPGQDVLQATTVVIERYWKCLDDETKQFFLREYMSEWSVHRHAMPMHTAERLLRHLESGQLRLLRVNPREEPTWDDQGFAVPTATEGVLHFDALVEGTGIEYNANKIEMPLMRNLLSSKTLTSHVAGGVHVDFKTLEAQKGLYVLGSMTRGIHFNTTAIDCNVRYAERLVDSMLGVPTRKSLHIALFASNDVFSQLKVSQLVPRLIASGHLPFVYLPAHKAGKRPQPFQVREMAFYERSLLQDHIIPHLGSDCNKAGPCMTVEQLRTKYGILVQSIPDVNDGDFVRSLSSNYIDLGYSVSCPQRFKTEIVSYFRSKQGLWAINPSVLPAHHAIPTARKAAENPKESSGRNTNQADEKPGAGALVDMQKCPIDFSMPMLNSIDDIWSIGVDVAEDVAENVARGRAPKASEKGEDEQKRKSFLYNQDIGLVDGEGIKKILIEAFTPQDGKGELATVVEKACVAWYNQNSAP